MTNDGFTETLDDLRELLNDHFNANTLSKQKECENTFPTDLTSLKGSFWAALYPNDNSWYRIRVIEVLEEDENDTNDHRVHVLIQYIDFGAVNIVPMNYLQPLTVQMCQTPALAVKCHLAHIMPFENSEGERIWTDDALSHFTELSGFENETIVTLNVLHRPSVMDFSFSLSVLMWNNTAIEHEDILVNALLVSENLAFTESTDWMDDADRLHETSSSGEDSESLRYDSPVNRPQDLIDAIILIKVTSVISPDHFHAILPFGTSSLDEVAAITGCESLHELVAHASEGPVIRHLSRLQREINLMYESSKSRQQDKVYQTGSIVGALSAKKSSGRVFRAKIMGVQQQQHQRPVYEIQDLDDGSVEQVSCDKVFDLSPDFVRIPAFAVKCSLANIFPNLGDAWSKDAV